VSTDGSSSNSAGGASPRSETARNETFRRETLAAGDAPAYSPSSVASPPVHLRRQRSWFSAGTPTSDDASSSSGHSSDAGDAPTAVEASASSARLSGSGLSPLAALTPAGHRGSASRAAGELLLDFNSATAATDTSSSANSNQRGWREVEL
jgi:hypothetical protein